MSSINQQIRNMLNIIMDQKRKVDVYMYDVNDNNFRTCEEQLIFSGVIKSYGFKADSDFINIMISDSVPPKNEKYIEIPNVDKLWLEFDDDFVRTDKPASFTIKWNMDGPEAHCNFIRT